ncbi:glycosyltransferase family 2 protein [Roseateles chitosanitabidus]|uniref:glycosyltransferase family 2 protein n=1 Tax=Roseateles chitosanitabidus TaxID=65048 RepID=UPI00082E4430|nr:glycosyltransferase family A protein [Roseateles chitosanitabidus]
MTSRPLLSVCIPTFNREGFLRECLESIQAAGLDDQFEVVVSDNASSDGTIGLLEEFRHCLPLRWVVQDTNIGPDRNFDAVVAFAQGEYCWLLGSDDVVEPHTIERLLRSLRERRNDILHFGYVQTDILLNRLYAAHPPAGQVDSTPTALEKYFGDMPNMSLLFTFISSFAFRRTIWMDRRDRVLGWVGTYYIHMLTMHAALAEGASLAATDECLVLARGGNPNDFNTVPGRFIALDAQTMRRLITEIHGDTASMWKAIGRTFRRSYPIKALIYTAANGGLHHLEEVRGILIRLGYPVMLLGSLRLLGKLNLLGIVKGALDLRRAAVTKLSTKVH